MKKKKEVKVNEKKNTKKVRGPVAKISVEFPVAFHVISLAPKAMPS